MTGECRSPAAHVLRDAARDAPEPGYHKPKTPIGRRGESLIICGLPARGSDLAGPASLPHQPEAKSAGGNSHSPWKASTLRAPIESQRAECPYSAAGIVS